MAHQAGAGGRIPEERDPSTLAASVVATMTEPFSSLCAEHPDVSHDVVVVLARDAEDRSPGEIGVKDYEPIPYQPGMFKTRMAGGDLLVLAERVEVEVISPDEEAKAL